MRLQLKSVVCNAAAAAAAALAWFRLELGLTGCALTKLKKKNASFILAPKAQTKAQKQGRPQKGGFLKDDQLAAAVILALLSSRSATLKFTLRHMHLAEPAK